MRKIWLVVCIVVLCLTGSSLCALADMDYSNGKYQNDGTLGYRYRFRGINTRDLSVTGMVQPGVVVVSSWTQFTQAGTGKSGASVFQIDLTAGNEFWIDVDAIATSVAAAKTAGTAGATIFQSSQLQTSGVTVMAPAATALNDKTSFKLRKIGTSGTTPVRLWGPSYTGTTIHQKIEAVYPITTTTGTSAYGTGSSVSDYPIYEPSDSRTYQLTDDQINSGDSIFVVDMTHRKPVLH